MRVYAWVGGDRPEDAAQAARDRVARGFRALKMNAMAEVGYSEPPSVIAEVVGRVEAVRAAVGLGVDIALDFHGRLHTAMAARLLEAVAHVEPAFVEEPVPPEHLERVRAAAPPSATWHDPVWRLADGSVAER
jgi:galactonate dehydratase